MWKEDVNFRKVIEFILHDEGGFANRKADKGRLTFMGVTERFFPKWEGWKIIYKYLEYFPELTTSYVRPPNTIKELNRMLYENTDLQALVREFYYDFFWMSLKLDKVESFAKQLLIMSTAVISGKPNAVKIMQICSGSVVDKIVGPNTIKATNNTSDKQFCYQYLFELHEFFTYLANSDSDYRASFLGWSNRDVALYKRVQQSFKGETFANI